jgi:predicted ATP-dependent serine protease
LRRKALSAGRGRKLSAEEEEEEEEDGPDWVCSSCGYENWRRRETCRNCHAQTSVEVRERISFAMPFWSQNDHLTKTGSGQT